MTKEDLLNISNELNLPIDVVLKTYSAYWYYIKNTIEALPLKEDITEEDFLKLKCNFNIPSLGKLYCTLDKFNRLKKRYNYIKELKDVKDNKD